MIAVREPRLFTFDKFLSWYLANSEIRYEFHGGEIVEMPKPIGTKDFE